MNSNNKIEKISSIILSISGLVLAIDVILYHFFDIGTMQNNFTILYCVAFILISFKYNNIFKKKHVVYPLYVLIAQTIYSLVNKWI